MVLRVLVPPPPLSPGSESGTGGALCSRHFSSNRAAQTCPQVRPATGAPSHPVLRAVGPEGSQEPPRLESGRASWSLGGQHGPRPGPAWAQPTAHSNRINYIFKRCRPAIPGEPGEPSIMVRPCFTSCRIVLTLVKRIFIFH